MARTPLEEGDRIARLLEEVQRTVGPSTWARVEELVRRIVTLYGDGLARVLEHAREAGRLDAALSQRLCDDELVASLLRLHGLHPVPAAERVAHALEALGERLPPEMTVELLGLDEVGVVRVRLSGAAGCGAVGQALARGVEAAVLEAAPEVRRVEVTGLDAAPGRERLVSLGRPGAGAAGAGGVAP